MQAIPGAVLFVTGLIVAQGLLALAEAALVGRRSRLKDRAAHGDRGAVAAIRLGEDTRAFRPALQAGITFLGSLAGVYAGVTLEPELTQTIEPTGPMAPYRDAIGMVCVALMITLATLVLGEWMPRRVALQQPEAVARLVARPVRGLAIVAGPLVRVLGSAGDRILGVMGIRPSSETPVTEESIQELMQVGTQAGVFKQAEHEMVKRVLRFGDRRAALMTPRNEIVWIDLADSPEEVRRKVISSPHSRFPVCDQSLDNLLGIVHVKDLLGHGQDVEPFRVKGHLTMPVFLYEGTHGLKILEMLKASGTHSAVVLDEYGTVEGLLTLTDILEAIVGDFPDRSEDEEPRRSGAMTARGCSTAGWPLDEFRDLLDLPAFPEGDFHTLAGLVVARLGHIPKAGEGFDDWGLHVEVTDMDGNRVNRLLVGRVDRAGDDP